MEATEMEGMVEGGMVDVGEAGVVDSEEAEEDEVSEVDGKFSKSRRLSGVVARG